MAATFFILKAGIAPPGLAAYPLTVRLMYWSWVVDLGLKRKDWELARGLNAKGEPLPGVAPETRKHRRSAMTPSGKGDPSAPYLMPGRGLSRTRSLLAGKAHADYAEFYWRYDPHTGDQWGRILAWHARRGKAYDVVGLSPAGIASVAQQAQRRWRRWLVEGHAVVSSPAVLPIRAPAAARIEPGGRANLTHAVFGIGGSKEQYQQALAEGRAGGLRTQAEWQELLRAKRPPIAVASLGTTSYSVRKGASNVVLQAVWSQPRPPAAASMRRAAMPPTAPPVHQDIHNPPSNPPLVAAPTLIPSPPAFPPSTATVAYLGDSEASRNRTREFVAGLFPKATEGQIASIVGAPDGATVEFEAGPFGRVLYKVRHPDLLTMEGSLRKVKGDVDHDPFSLYVMSSAQGKGVGAEIHGRRVAFGAEHGVTRLKIAAARGQTEIGYIVWPGMGYDGKLPKSVLDKLPEQFKGRTTIQELMADEGGQKWWKKNGETFTATFDLAPGSPSIMRWATYWARRLARNSGK